MKKQLNLSELSVKSFQTSEKEAVNGGFTFTTCPPSNEVTGPKWFGCRPTIDIITACLG